MLKTKRGLSKVKEELESLILSSTEIKFHVRNTVLKRLRVSIYLTNPYQETVILIQIGKTLKTAIIEKERKNRVLMGALNRIHPNL